MKRHHWLTVVTLLVLTVALELLLVNGDWVAVGRMFLPAAIGVLIVLFVYLIRCSKKEAAAERARRAAYQQRLTAAALQASQSKDKASA